MALKVLDHPLVETILTQLRDVETPFYQYRRLTHQISRFLLMEATRFLYVEPIDVQTPMEITKGAQLQQEVVVVPILRAGLGMLEAFQELLPQATVGYIGLRRNEETARAEEYLINLPPVEGRTIFILDPMLATGGSAVHALNAVYTEMPSVVVFVSIVAAPEGIAKVQDTFPDVQIITAAVDRELNSNKFILPGLGDFGDRLFGTE